MAGYSFGNGLMLDPGEELRAGEERGKKSALTQLLGKAYGAPQQERGGLLGMAAAIDPQVAMQADTSFRTRDTSRRDDFIKRATMAAKAWKAGAKPMAQSIYQTLLPEAQAIAPGMPLPSEIDESFVQMAEMLGAGGDAEQFTLTPGAARYDASGKVIASQPLAPANANIINVPDGNGGTVQMIFDPKTRQLSEPQYPGAVPQGPSGGAPAVLEGAYEAEADPLAIQSLFKQLAPQFGAQITSLQRSPQHNEKVGGVANSQHLTGTAGDFVVPESQKAAFRQTMQAKGFEVIDEGDHMHVELPSGRRAGRMGYTPPKANGGKDSALQERIRVAREMGASDDEIRRMVIGREGAAAGAKPMPVGAVKADMEIEDALGASEVVFSLAAKHLSRMADGRMVVGTPEALGAKVRTFANMPTGNDIALTELNADRKKIVNETLRLNKGVQTEGDAERATQELMAANDHKTTLAALKRLVELNKRAVDLQRRKRELLYRNYGRGAEQPAQAPASDGVDDLLSKYGVR